MKSLSSRQSIRLTRRRKIIRRILWSLLILFVMMNIVAFFHAWKFTHFSAADTVRTAEAEKLNSAEKLKALFFGINNPRPENRRGPSQNYTTLTLHSNRRIECWRIDTANAKGTVVLFHGYCGNKGMMLQKSDSFLSIGYNTMLVDFMGSGGSEGYQTTLGYYESVQVSTVYRYLKRSGEKNIILYGNSMGAVAIMKAISEDSLKPSAIILECPFGTMYETVCARFRIMKAPVFPMAGLLVFWGGIQNGFWAYSHNPVDYAADINCPALLMYGEKDEKVSRSEIDEIFSQLKGEKRLKLFRLAGHESYLKKYPGEWISDIDSFLKGIPEK